MTPVDSRSESLTEERRDITLPSDPRPPVTLDDAEQRLVTFACSCYIEDTEKQLRGKFKTTAQPHAFKQLADLQRLLYLKMIPDALCGPDTLADGTVIKPGDPYVHP